MPTIQKFLSEHQDELDRKFIEKYPQGQFVIQLWYGFGLYRNMKRNTSRVHYGNSSIGGVYFSKRDGRGVVKEKYQNCSFGKCYYYSTIKSFLAGCVRHAVPIELIEAFVEEYKTK